MGWNHQLDNGDPLHHFLRGGAAEIVQFIPGAGTEPKAVLGGGFFSYISRIHTAYIGEDSSIFKVPEMFGDCTFESGKPTKLRLKMNPNFFPEPVPQQNSYGQMIVSQL